MTNIAVYGTLRKDQGNDGLLRGSPLVARGVTESLFKMYSTGGFPICVPHPQGVGITVEVYAVDDNVLSNVDSLEGYPGWYKREQYTVLTDDGVQTAWMYYMDEPSRSMPEVYSGDWLDRYDYR